MFTFKNRIGALVGVRLFRFTLVARLVVFGFIVQAHVRRRWRRRRLSVMQGDRKEMCTVVTATGLHELAHCSEGFELASIFCMWHFKNLATWAMPARFLRMLFPLKWIVSFLYMVLVRWSTLRSSRRPLSINLDRALSTLFPITEPASDRSLKDWPSPKGSIVVIISGRRSSMTSPTQCNTSTLIIPSISVRAIPSWRMGWILHWVQIVHRFLVFLR